MPFLYPLVFKKNISDKNYHKEIAQLEVLEADSSDGLVHDDGSAGVYRRPSFARKNFTSENLQVPLFYFDPNKISVADWQKLGVKEKTATGILHYVEKGGKFRQPADIEKIWGLSKELKQRLMPYIRIQPPEEKYYETRIPPHERKVYERKAIVVVDVNDADTAAYIALPGIGSKLAQRIISFREKLGGFYSVDQVGETFGLPDSVFQKIRLFLKMSEASIRKININTATQDELKIHPYIRWQVANAIVQYRQQHGSFSSIDQLKNIALLKEEAFSKIAPYLKLED